MKPGPICACVSVALACGLATAGMAQSGSAKVPAKRVATATEGNLASRVQIAPTAMRTNAATVEKSATAWSAHGLELKALIAQIYNVDVRQVDLADAGNASGRFDLTVSLPREVSADEMRSLLADAVQRKFGVDIAPEVRSMYVYAMTAPNGPGSGLHPHAIAARAENRAMQAEQSANDGTECSGAESAGIAVTDKTIAELGRTMERGLDRVLLDETNLAGTYDVQLGAYRSKEELFQLLREQLGLVVRLAERKVTVVKVRPHGEFAI